MTWVPLRVSQPMAVFPRTISWIAVSVGGLAVFLIACSCILLTSPIGSTVQGYFYGINGSQKFSFPISPANDQTNIDPRLADNSNVEDKISSRDVDAVDRNKPSESDLEVTPNSPAHSIGLLQNNGSKDVSPSSNILEKNEIGGPVSVVSLDSSNSLDLGPKDDTSDMKLRNVSNPSQLQRNAIKTDSVASGCDLYHGSWIHDSAGPLYTNNSCPVLTQMQNCQGNGRPDKDYENWRWRPFQCELPRFDAKKFLEMMRGKTLAFIGDSVARNQMESLLCILWQVEIPKNRGNRRMQRYFFKSNSVMIVRIWSSWLVKQTSGPLDFAPEGVVKLHLDAPDDNFMEFIPTFDVIVLSSGHWFAKQSVYVLNNEIVGGQLWWPNKSRPMRVNNVEAFGISVETILTALATHPNYTGIMIVRSYSPDHYEGGAWNMGGSCTGKERPLGLGELAENGFTNIMHEKQVNGFNRSVEKATKKSKLRLMDITQAFGYRHDGHPGPYRSPDPNKLTKRGPDGKPPPQDCLHWCMPGPVDTWNELLMEVIRRDYKGEHSFSS